MRLSRIDFIDNDKCDSCPQKITTRIAYIVELDDGSEKQYGPQCIKKIFKEIPEVPNLTRASLVYDSKESNIAYFGDSHDCKVNDNMVLEYLLLRCKLLDDFVGIKYARLNDIFIKNKNDIDNYDKKYIRAIMEKLKDTKLGYKNLMACYMAKRILTMCIEKIHNDFAKNIYEQLKIKYNLTEKQINGVNNWIKNIKNVPIINKKWFVK